jgi:hypothetical protein
MNSSNAKNLRHQSALLSALLSLLVLSFRGATAAESLVTIQDFAEKLSAAHSKLVVGVELVPGLGDSFKQAVDLSAVKDLELFARLLSEQTAYEALIGKNSIWIFPKDSELKKFESLKTKTALAKRMIVAKATSEPRKAFEVISRVTGESGTVALLPLNGVISPAAGTIDLDKITITIPADMSVSVAEWLTFLSSRLGAKLCFITHGFDESKDGTEIPAELGVGYVEFR